MSALHPRARELLESDALVHLVTLNPDGSPQLTCVWVGLDGDEIVSGHMQRSQKVLNVERDPRVVLSLEADGLSALGCASTSSFTAVHGYRKEAPPTCFSGWPIPTSARTSSSRRASTPPRPATSCASPRSGLAASGPWADGPA